MELILEVCPQTPYKSHLIADHQFMKKMEEKDGKGGGLSVQCTYCKTILGVDRT